MKRQNQLNIKRGLLSKLVLLVALFLGSSNAWGGIIFDGNTQSTIENWTVSNLTYNSTIKGYQTWGTGTITSDDNIVFPTGSQFIINARGIGSSTTRAIKIEYSSNDGISWEDAGTFSASSDPAIDASSGVFKNFAVELSGTYKIRITGTAIVIRVISKEEPSGPVAPTNFTVSSIAYDGARLSWSAGGTETQWQVYYSKVEGEPAEGDVPAAINTPSKDLTGLLEKTKYYCYVRSYIDSETHSLWAKTSFTTYEQYPTPTNFALSSHDASTATFTWNNGLGATPTSWELKYSTNANFNPDSEGTRQSVGENPPYTLENLTENVTYFAYLRAYYLADDKYSNWTEKLMFVPTTADFVLDENNVTSISTISSKKVLLKYRPSNGWNTMCMPFPPNFYMTTIFGSGYKAYALKSYSSGILTFEKASYIGASTPYVVYSESVPDNPNGVVLTGVTIYDGGLSPSSTTKGGATLQGTFASKYFVEGDNWYGLTTAGKVMKAGEGAYVKGYRAYFTGVTPPESSARISIVFEGEDDGETTDLGFVRMIDPEAKNIYTLSGQKVEKAGKGIYIVNGRKVVIK